MSKAQPFTQTDLERGEAVVRALHGLRGYETWAETIAKAIAAERERVIVEFSKRVVGAVSIQQKQDSK